MADLGRSRNCWKKQRTSEVAVKRKLRRLSTVEPGIEEGRRKHFRRLFSLPSCVVFASRSMVGETSLLVRVALMQSLNDPSMTLIVKGQTVC